jgi:anti-anti-sigma factor
MLIEIQKQKQYHGVCILHCEGSLVPGAEMDYLQTKLDEIKRLPCHRLLIDFQNVAAIGSMGVTFIVGAYSSVTRQPGGCMVLTGVNRYVRQVLDLTRLSTLIPLAPDLASGLAMLRAEPPLSALSLSNCSSANV